MKRIRKLHFWIGTLFAPTILFFALSGAFQVLGLHEDGSTWIAKMGQVHKDQTIASLPERRPPRPEPTATAVAGDPQTHAAVAKPARVPPHRSTVLEVWFILMAVSLMVSTGLGIYMAFAYKRDRLVITALLVAGTLIPVVGLFL